MINRRGCGSLKESPILSAIGTRSTAAIVCEMLSSQVRVPRLPDEQDSQRSDDQGDQREDDENAVQPQTLHQPLEEFIEVVQETR